jgi:hypothetical protein
MRSEPVSIKIMNHFLLLPLTKVLRSMCDQQNEPVVPKSVSAKDSQAEVAALVEKSKRIRSEFEGLKNKLDALLQSVFGPDAKPGDDGQPEQKNR